MPNSYSKKFAIVEAVLKEYPKDDETYKDLTIDQIIFIWFATGRAGEGLRLTEKGYKAFLKADIAHYDYDFDSLRPHGGHFMVLLNKNLKCPYYIGVTNKRTLSLRVYDHKIAMMITLYGSLDLYLESIGVYKK